MRTRSGRTGFLVVLQPFCVRVGLIIAGERESVLRVTHFSDSLESATDYTLCSGRSDASGLAAKGTNTQGPDPCLEL
jgi:hypothetical protein